MLESADLITDSLPGTGEDQHRAWRASRPFPQQIQNLDSVHVGKLEVEKGQVGQLLARDADALGTRMRNEDFVAGALEDTHRQRCQLRVILDHQDPGRLRPHAAGRYTFSNRFDNSLNWS
jgi:hypothetical protein